MNQAIKQVGMMLVEVILFIGIMALTYAIIGGALLYLNVVDVSDFEQTSIDRPYHMLLLDYLPVLLGALVATIIVHRVIFKRQLPFSGFGKQKLFAQFGAGLAWSAVLLTIGFVLLYALGMMEILRVNMDSYLFIGFFLFFLVQSSFEEFAMRSFLLPTVAHRSSIWVGIIISALVFSLLHFDNQNINPLSLINILLAGVLLGILFVSTGQIWAPIGLHAGWNFLQGTFYGYEVSGIDVYSYIDSREVGPDLWTGGAFGFEGSILATVLLSMLSIYYWKKNPDRFVGSHYPKGAILSNDKF